MYEEFYDKLDGNYIPEPNSGCWLWTASMHGEGNKAYGIIKSKRAHRVSYEKHKGTIPYGYEVLHSCDIPFCINPDHLRIGTHLDNMQDMVHRNRESVQGRVLTVEQISEIRNRSESSRVLAIEYGVSHTSIQRIIKHMRYKKV